MSGLVAASLLVGACSKPAVPVRKPFPDGSMAWVTVSAEGAPPGLSGWSEDPNGTLWAVPERTALLVPLRAERAGISQAGAALPIDGLRPGEQLESVAAVSSGRWVVGTEGHGESRGSDDLLWLERQGDRAKVVRRVSLSYSVFPVAGEDNRGMEALCVVGDQVLILIEPVALEKGQRLGLLARYANERFQVLRVPLTTDSGKVSGMDCRAEGERIQVVAIERHYGVVRLLRFELPRAPAEQPLSLESSVVRDVSAALEQPPNFEGLSWRGDGYWLLSDNHHGRVTGPTEALWVAR